MFIDFPAKRAMFQLNLLVERHTGRVERLGPTGLPGLIDPRAWPRGSIPRRECFGSSHSSDARWTGIGCWSGSHGLRGDMPVGSDRHREATSSARDRTDHAQGVGPGAHRVGEPRVRQVVREVASASEETDERASPIRSVVADRAPQHRVARFQSVQHRGDRRRIRDFELYLAFDSRKRTQVGGERDPDRSHGIVWTSTEDTLGRYSAIASHVSPASADA